MFDDNLRNTTELTQEDTRFNIKINEKFQDGIDG